MNEGLPTQESNIESEGSLEEKREQGHQHAESIIENLEGFAEMDYREQFAALTEIESTLEDNDIYAAEYIGAYRAAIKYKEARDEAVGSLKEIEEHYGIAA